MKVNLPCHNRLFEMDGLFFIPAFDKGPRGFLVSSHRHLNPKWAGMEGGRPPIFCQYRHNFKTDNIWTETIFVLFIPLSNFKLHPSFQKLICTTGIFGSRSTPVNIALMKIIPSLKNRSTKSLTEFDIFQSLYGLLLKAESLHSKFCTERNIWWLKIILNLMKTNYIYFKLKMNLWNE